MSASEDRIRLLLAAQMHVQRVTHAELAARIGVRQPTVTRWLNGKRSIGLADADAMFAALGLELFITDVYTQPAKRVRR